MVMDGVFITGIDRFEELVRAWSLDWIDTLGRADDVAKLFPAAGRSCEGCINGLADIAAVAMAEIVEDLAPIENTAGKHASTTRVSSSMFSKKIFVLALRHAIL